MSDFLTDWLRRRTGRLYHTVDFGFDGPLDGWLAAFVLAAVFAGLCAWTWRALDLTNGPRSRHLVVLRAAALTLLVFAALGPTLSGRRSDPATRLVLLVFDDSASMAVPGSNGASNGDRLLAAYREDDGRFERLLASSYAVRRFRFGRAADRLRAASDLRFDQTESNILDAIEAARSSATGSAVSAVVLFSDGVQQPGAAPDLTAFDPDVPVFTVGVGGQDVPSSLALDHLTVTRTNFDRSPVSVVAHVRSHGLAGRRAVVEVSEGAKTVAASTVGLTETGAALVRFEFVPDLEGFREYTARVRLADGPESLPGVNAPVDPDDPVAVDNETRFVVDNRKRVRRILYFSGRPNWQQKFVRRAFEEDPRLDVSSLIRISGPERKFEFRGARTSMANPLFEGSAEEGTLSPRWDEAVFLRIGVREAELAQGYPSSPGDLFRYDLVIWGDVERDFFAQSHLELTRDFVSRRGGSFLVLGGPRALERGGYTGTVIESMLPVVLPGAARDPRDDTAFLPDPTIEGLLSGIFALDPDPDRNAAIWRTLPQVFGVNRFAATRAGASVMARLIGPGELNNQPFFAWQRFGEGLTAVLATGETWSWELGTEPGHEAHGRFWRQMVRGLVEPVAEPVVVSGTDELMAGRTDTLRVVIRDSLFVPREGLLTQVHARGPDGTTNALPVSESLDETGVYHVPVDFSRIGTHTLSVTARDAAGQVVARSETAFPVHPDHREVAAGRYDPDFLRRLASRTDGRFFTLDQLDDLAAALPVTAGSREHLDRVPLWHLPPIYGIAVLLLMLDWYLRRRQGHP